MQKTSRKEGRGSAFAHHDILNGRSDRVKNKQFCLHRHKNKKDKDFHCIQGINKN